MRKIKEVKVATEYNIVDFTICDCCGHCQRLKPVVVFFCPWCGFKQRGTPLIRELKKTQYFGWNINATRKS